MNEKFLNDLLSAGIRRGEVRFELTDTVVDSILEHPAPEAINASKARVQWKLQLRLQDAAIAAARNEVSEHSIPFGRFVEAVRERAGITRAEIAQRIRKPEQFVQRIERGDLKPVEVPVPDLANIVCVFNIKIPAIRQMIAASVAAADEKVNYRAAARSHGGRRHDARGEDVERALDAFALNMRQKKNPTAATQIPLHVEAYVAKVQIELARLRRNDLLV